MFARKYLRGSWSYLLAVFLTWSLWLVANMAGTSDNNFSTYQRANLYHISTLAQQIQYLEENSSVLLAIAKDKSVSADAQQQALMREASNRGAILGLRSEIEMAAESQRWFQR